LQPIPKEQARLILHQIEAFVMAAGMLGLVTQCRGRNGER